jgi:hypothetical protein
MYNNRNNIAHLYRKLWYDHERQIDFLPEFGIDELREHFLIIQTIHENPFEYIRFRCFVGLLCQWTMRYRQCVYQIVLPTLDAQLRFLEEWPVFITRWDNYSQMKRWYLMISAYCETKIASRHNIKDDNPRYALNMAEDIDYGTRLEEAKLIKLISWNEYVTTATISGDEQYNWITQKVNPVEQFFDLPFTPVPGWPQVGWNVPVQTARPWPG